MNAAVSAEASDVYLLKYDQSLLTKEDQAEYKRQRINTNKRRRYHQNIQNRMDAIKTKNENNRLHVIKTKKEICYNSESDASDQKENRKSSLPFPELNINSTPEITNRCDALPSGQKESDKHLVPFHELSINSTNSTTEIGNKETINTAQAARERISCLSSCPSKINATPVTKGKQTVYSEYATLNESELREKVVMNKEGSKFCRGHNSMTCWDVKQLLEHGSMLTDAPIQFYRTLLLERDHTMWTDNNTWTRSGIMSTYFYSELVNPKRITNKKDFVKMAGNNAPGSYRHPIKKHDLRKRLTNCLLFSHPTNKILGGDIFKLDKLLIPINIPNVHFFLACVFVKEKKIEVFDSLGSKDGRKDYVNNIKNYLFDEYKRKHDNKDPKYWKDWIYNCSTRPVCKQTGGSNDCGLFTCLYMDFLLLNLPMNELSQDAIVKFGRQWIYQCLLDEKIVF